MMLTALSPLLVLAQPSDFYIRVNQVGYLPGETKVAVLFSKKPIKEKIEIVRLDDGSRISSFNIIKSNAKGWGTFDYYYQLDFTSVQEEGKYFLRGQKSGIRSQSFPISKSAYSFQPEYLLEFMRQQRCGYNPFFDMVCHQRDGRAFYGKMPDSTFVDATGGWHDAGDQLKYLITGSYATGHMLMAYEIYPDRFEDLTNALGQPIPNGIPDVLDEAKWGLNWILKLHVSPDQLIHQVADDRDHYGWKMPDQDNSDYGWGENSYRVAYFATGSPQGLRQYKSIATGLANLAGRSAAALAQGSRIWESLGDTVFAKQCATAAKTLYQLGREKEGFQQGNSYRAPYRYTEETWADDMEYGAAELYKLTRDKRYLNEAKQYAIQANTISWMNLDSAAHYQYYPFINLGHFALFDLVDKPFQDTLAGYYKNGIEYTFKKSQKNPYGVGVPFIWCSNNLMTSLNTQIILYEKMTGDKSYHDFLIDQRDWLLGRNPWGTSMFTGIPETGEYPEDVHTGTWALTKKMVPGGLVDGPIFSSIYNSLKGITLYTPDEFEHLQNDYVVYHDDIGDYSTNEPTMDGTAGSIIMMVHWTLDLNVSRKK
ncbi:glycoside hydrolase family 9 protein [Flexithrix dorotheae]|uniref:glycoside hydrolase family 9 protein n=1 Tax=Flexithrix dorotheae TaxID=70993 RepID=UPI001FDFA34A|nr:glycoside hydrolase family 9 protein [Flexithrix dorotheae]